MSPFIAAYREGYSTQYVLVVRRLIKEWWKKLDDDWVAGGVRVDLSKTFDCNPHDLLITKLDSYGLDRNLLKYINSYLGKRKQCVRINDINSNFNDIFSGVPQGSVGGQILFNAFLMIFSFLMQHPTIHNFADDNTFSQMKRHKLETKISKLYLDDRLNFNEHISNIYKFSANQLSTLWRLKTSNDTLMGSNGL